MGWARALKQIVKTHVVNIDAWHHGTTSLGYPINMATNGGHKQAVEALLDLGANIEESFKREDLKEPGRPLHFAVRNNDVELVKFLLNSGTRSEDKCGLQRNGSWPNQ